MPKNMIRAEIDSTLAALKRDIAALIGQCKDGLLRIDEARAKYAEYWKILEDTVPRDSRAYRFLDLSSLSKNAFWPGSGKYLPAGACGMYSSLMQIVDRIEMEIEREFPSPSAIPAPEDYFLRSPLYDKYEVGKDYKSALRIEFFGGTLDTYCVACGKTAVFRSISELPYVGSAMTMSQPGDIEDMLGNYSVAWFRKADESGLSEADLSKYAIGDRIIPTVFKCTRNEAHTLHFYTRVQAGDLWKIGQDPSRAEMEYPELDAYRQVLGREKYKELTRAVGLVAHGVGIGSFVYLRRIFEDLVERAHQQALLASDWDEDEYIGSRMAERIALLQQHLPKFLVENRALYGILSKGVHELSEAECLTYFDPVRKAIELILDDLIQEQERKRKIAAASASLSAIHDEIRKPSRGQ